MANTRMFAAVAAVSAVLIGSLFASLSTESQDAFAKPVDVARPAAQKVLRVGSLTAYPPFEYLDTESGRYEGFDMDLIREVGKRMDREIEIVSMGLDALIPALLAKSVDVAVSALTITPERAAKVDFTKPYYDAGLTIMTTKANAPKITGPESLENQCLCAEIGSAGAVYMKRIPGATIRTFNSAAEAFMELSQGGCFAMVNDRPVNEYFLAQKSSKGMGLTEMPLRSLRRSVRLCREQAKRRTPCAAQLDDRCHEGGRVVRQDLPQVVRQLTIRPAGGPLQPAVGACFVGERGGA